MGDRYNAPYHGDHERNSRRRAPNNFPPPPPPPPARPPPLRDPYRERDYGQNFTFRGAADRNGYDRGYSAPRGHDRGQDQKLNRPPPHDYQRRGNDNFRPQAERIQPPQGNFTFTYEAQGAPAPRFPPAGPSLPARPPSPRRMHDVRHRDAPRSGNHGNGRYPRSGGRDKARHPPRRPPIKPSNRDLLHVNRETTPEQLAGMNAEGTSRFREVALDEDDESIEHGDDGNVRYPDGPSQKRTKLDIQTAPKTAPKWSNPDPYTSLPAPDSGAPKKDIVQFIRKAKIETLTDNSGSATAKKGVDFISLDVDDEPGAETTDSEQSLQLPPRPPPPPFQVAIPSAADTAHTGASKKRGKKRALEREQYVGHVTDEWVPDGTNPTPWYRQPSSFIDNVGLKLHMEIVDFYEFVRPTPGDKVVRDNVVESIQHAVHAFQGPYNSRNVSVYTFGSFAQGLYLPTADMDLVAISEAFHRSGRPAFCQSANQLRRLLAHLTSQGLVKPGTGIVINSARVPLVKFTHARSNIRIDISFENSTGIKAIDTVASWARQFPEMPVLVALVKQFLAMRNLHEVFHGGIGGFTIICLVVHMLSLRPEYKSGQPTLPNYGFLLLEFFDLYGNRFNHRDTGIQMAPMKYFDKREKPPRTKYQIDRLTVIDPNNSQNDVSGGSREIIAVLDSFRKAHARIQSQLNQIQNGDTFHGSVLECVLGGNYSSFAQQRARNGELYQTLGPLPEYRFGQDRASSSYHPSQKEHESVQLNPPTGKSSKKAKGKKRKAKPKKQQKPGNR